jgi:hypothetical protein
VARSAQSSGGITSTSACMAHSQDACDSPGSPPSARSSTLRCRRRDDSAKRSRRSGMEYIPKGPATSSCPSAVRPGRARCVIDSPCTSTDLMCPDRYSRLDCRTAGFPMSRPWRHGQARLPCSTERLSRSGPCNDQVQRQNARRPCLRRSPGAHSSAVAYALNHEPARCPIPPA